MAPNKNYTFRDLVGIVLLVALGIGNYYIFRNDLERQDERVKSNAELIKTLGIAVHQIELRNATDSARHESLAEQIRGIERRLRRIDREDD